MTGKPSLTYVPTIGIAGGIGSGKSQVAAELALCGCVVSDSDLQSRAVLREACAAVVTSASRSQRRWPICI